MLTISGYQVVEKLCESSRFVIYRARRDSDQEFVMLKRFRQEYPSPAAISRFQMEYDILHALDVTGVIKAYGLEFDQQSPVLVLEDFGGESLHAWLQHRIFNLEEFLTLAIQITSVLSGIHQHHIIHKDINPSNLVLNPITKQVKLIDFGIATILSQESPTLRNPNLLEGTLAYISPEQTGRMNRAIDYRTDFYSLGVTLYQLLCDRLPFATADPLELVHCHIAKQPIPPHELGVQGIGNREQQNHRVSSTSVSPIPKIVSDIVMKLLAKNAEDRYQSAHAIWADLQECLNQLQETQQIASFPVGRWDFSSTLQIPQKLYGREQEVAALLTTFERLTLKTQNAPRSEFMLVSGSPGIGKTTLVQELYKPMTRQRGYFITGKYEQFQHNIPYSGLIQAFRALIRQLLSESDAQVASWRKRLLEALGDNAQIAIDVIPDIELILGKQPAEVALPFAAANNCFHLALEAVVRVLTQFRDLDGTEQPRPLIIFLDDLQWADSASLQLIQHWITVLDAQPLLVIGAYREQEVDTAHPLRRSLREIQQAGRAVQHIALSPLGLANISHLIQDTLHCSTEKALPLAELTLQKTGGNPFFINEFLHVLHQTTLLGFNRQTGVWEWDLQRIRAAQVTDNVVELVTTRIQELSAPVQQALSLAACLGSQFELRSLAHMSEKSLLETAANLRIAAEQNLITPLGDEYKYLESYLPATSVDLDVTYKFLHDRIHHAAYSLLSETDQLNHHLNIGRFLLQSTPEALLEDTIFDIVDHLNRGAALITEPRERTELAQLNLSASRKAKAATAYEAALKYLHLGQALLASDRWQSAYEVALALSEVTAEVAYLTGGFEEMERRIEEVLQQAQTALDRTKVYLVKIQACIAQERFLEAIQIALQALALFGVELPLQPDQNSIAEGLAETKRLLATKQSEELLQLPRMTEPYTLAAMQIIASVCTPTYFLAPDLWKLMVFQKVQLSLHYGNAPGSAFGYADYGMIQCAVEENIDTGYQFAQLAMQLQPQLEAREFIPKTSLLVNMYLRHWQEHLKETLHPLLEAYQCGLETGDLEYATFAIAFRFYHSYLIGRSLTQLEPEMASYEGAIAQFKQALPLALTRLYRQAVLNLIESSETPWCLVGDSYNEVEQLPQLLAANDKYLLFHLYLNKLMLACLFQEAHQAAEYATTTAQLLSEGAVGLLVVPVFYFYDSLAKIAGFPEASQTEQSQILQAIAANQQKMHHWADRAPMNYRHKFYLVEAERQRLLGQADDDDDSYDRAIDLAQAHGYLNEEAMANELAGRFYLTKGKPKIARAYLLDARHGYLRWGAIAKVNDLDQRYPQFFDRLPERAAALTRSQQSVPTTSSSTENVALDLAALMKASQALSDEIVLDKLLTKLMAILIENAGAQRGYLLLESNGNFQIEAEGDIDANRISVLQAIPIEHESVGNQLPLAIVHYVTRTQESVVFNHATQDYRFDQDPYILSHQPKSILCTPLVHQGKLSGILYLENNLTLDAFTPERLQLLQFLSTQAAISIDNAQLYNHLEQRVQLRTAELTQTNDRLQTEIVERQRSEQTLRRIVEGTASATGVDFFRSLVRSLAQALGVRYAFISECMDAVPTRVRSFAFWQGDTFGDAFEYDLHGTPCELVMQNKGYQCFPAQIQALFPEEKEELEAMQAQSYAGIALLDSLGNLLGHLAILDDQPLDNQSRTQAVLEIFAARAAAEMERQQAEDALRESEARFRALVEQAVDAFFLIDHTGRFLDANQRALNNLGYTREELLTLHASNVQKRFPPGGFESVWQQMAAGQPITLDGIHQRKDGTRFPVEVHAGLIEWGGRKVELAVVRDITERKRAEEALRISETKFSTAFRSSPDAITISTLKDGCYIEVNDSCLRMLGYSRDEMLGRSAVDLGVWTSSSDRDTLKHQLQQHGSVNNLEVTLRRRSGERFPSLFSSEVIHLEEEPCLLSVATDITPLKQAEKALERLAEIGELAAMIVHEVRNPLTTISMGLTAFKKLELSGRFQEYLALSLDEAARLQRLLNQILLYSRPQTLQRSPLELNGFISETINPLKAIPAASEKRLELIAPSESLTVLADRDKLKQVVINLVTNAYEAVSEGETITVQIQATENDQVCLQIHNGGTPIPADVLPKLTKPFFTTKPTGTGLGLAIVKRIVEAHDGKFSIESSAATGTIVKMQLPLARLSEG
jgi:PAS domain S-box-containing protein